jgi:hypothetical protein
MMMVGPSGGALTSSDGKLAVDIPAGALTGDVTITTEAAAAPAAGAVGTVYEIGPTGTQFAMPVTLTLHYDMAMLNGAAESSLRVATFANGAWQLLPGAVVDANAKTVSGVTTHLSPYAVIPEAVGKTCASVQQNYGCTGTGPAVDAGASNGGGSRGAGGSPGSTGTAAACDPPTCATATNVCGQYPGATVDSCADGMNGFTADCCFPSNAPICFAIGGAGHTCTNDPAGGGGSSCPPAPTCATATAACAAYPGATLQNCTDSTNGFSGACCFAPEAPVCVSVGAGRACSNSTGAGGGSCAPAPRCSDGNPCAGYVGATTQGCTDNADGFQATCCFAVGTLPIFSGSGSGGGSGNVDAGVPAADGGMVGGGTCVAGAACTAGYRCDPGSTTTCMTCMCGANGTLQCAPCGGGT